MVFGAFARTKSPAILGDPQKSGFRLYLCLEEALRPVPPV